MKSQDRIDLQSEVVTLLIALQGAKEKILEYQQGKEEIDESLMGALYWIERGLNKDGDHSMPITKLTNDEVAVLQEIARQHLAQKTLMETMEVTDADLARTSLTVRDNEGNKVIGRKVAKVAVNLRLDKPLIEIVDTQCKQMGMKKTDWIRMALWQFVQHNNITMKAQQRIEGEVYPGPQN